MSYFASSQTRTLGGDTFRALVHAETGEIVAWVRETHVATIAAAATAASGKPGEGS